MEGVVSYFIGYEIHCPGHPGAGQKHKKIPLLLGAGPTSSGYSQLD